MEDTSKTTHEVLYCARARRHGEGFSVRAHEAVLDASARVLVLTATRAVRTASSSLLSSSSSSSSSSLTSSTSSSHTRRVRLDKAEVRALLESERARLPSAAEGRHRHSSSSAPPPECFFAVSVRDGDVVLLAAKTLEESHAWQQRLKQVAATVDEPDPTSTPAGAEKGAEESTATEDGDGGEYDPFAFENLERAPERASGGGKDGWRLPRVDETTAPTTRVLEDDMRCVLPGACGADRVDFATLCWFDETQLDARTGSRPRTDAAPRYVLAVTRTRVVVVARASPSAGSAPRVVCAVHLWDVRRLAVDALVSAVRIHARGRTTLCCVLPALAPACGALVRALRRATPAVLPVFLGAFWKPLVDGCAHAPASPADVYFAQCEHAHRRADPVFVRYLEALCARGDRHLDLTCVPVCDDDDNDDDCGDGENDKDCIGGHNGGGGDGMRTSRGKDGKSGKSDGVDKNDDRDSKDEEDEEDQDEGNLREGDLRLAMLARDDYFAAVSSAHAAVRDGYALAARVLASNSSITALTLRDAGGDERKQFARLCRRLCAARRPLAWLDLSGSAVRGAAGPKDVAALAARVPALRHVALARCQLAPRGLRALLAALAARAAPCALEHLDLSGNPLDEDVCAKLNDWFRPKGGASDSGSDAAPAVALASSTSAPAGSLTRSRGGSSETKTKSGQKLGQKTAPLVHVLPRLRTLKMADCGAVIARLPALAQLEALAELDVSGSKLGDEACRVLRPVVAHLTSLRTLDCTTRGTALAGLVAAFLAADNAAADTLAVSCTDATATAALLTALSTAPALSRLRHLHVGTASATPKDFVALCNALCTAPASRLIELVFDGLPEGDTAAVADAIASLIARAADAPPALTLRRVSPRVVCACIARLAGGPLTHLTLDGCALGDRGVGRLAQALPALTALRALVLRGTGVRAAGLKALAAALVHAPHLVALSAEDDIAAAVAAAPPARAAQCLSYAATIAVHNRRQADGADENAEVWTSTLPPQFSRLAQYIAETEEKEDVKKEPKTP